MPLTLKQLCVLNKMFVKGKVFGLFGHAGPVMDETKLIENELVRIIDKRTFTADSEPFLHSTIDKIENANSVNKPYVLIKLVQKNKEALYQRIKQINNNLLLYNSLHKFPIRIVDYSRFNKTYFNQLLSEETYYTHLMFSTCPPHDNALSIEWFHFFETCVNQWWNGVYLVLHHS